MVYRVYVEKKKELANEAKALYSELKNLLNIQSLKEVRILNRYDLENIEEDLFNTAKTTVLSEPQLDILSYDLPKGDFVFAVEYLPGQYDQRADSAAQCIQIISCGERPLIRTARVYVLDGKLTGDEIKAIKKFVINPVEAREAALEVPKTLKVDYAIPTEVKTLTGFIDYNDEQ